MNNLPGFKASFGLARVPNVEGLHQPTSSSRSRRQNYNRCLQACMRKGGSFSSCANACGFRLGRSSSSKLTKSPAPVVRSAAPNRGMQGRRFSTKG
jgi:hypothetical protein